jgi:hypothetical protein
MFREGSKQLAKPEDLPDAIATIAFGGKAGNASQPRVDLQATPVRVFSSLHF